MSYYTEHSVSVAWQKASDCGQMAREAANADARKLYEHLRNSWIEIANNLQFVSEDIELRNNTVARSLLQGSLL
jgi:hypothetical protein